MEPSSTSDPSYSTAHARYVCCLAFIVQDRHYILCTKRCSTHTSLSNTQTPPASIQPPPLPPLSLPSLSFLTRVFTLLSTPPAFRSLLTPLRCSWMHPPLSQGLLCRVSTPIPRCSPSSLFVRLFFIRWRSIAFVWVLVIIYDISPHHSVLLLRLSLQEWCWCSLLWLSHTPLCDCLQPHFLLFHSFICFRWCLN